MDEFIIGQYKHQESALYSITNNKLERTYNSNYTANSRYEYSEAVCA